MKSDSLKTAVRGASGEVLAQFLVLFVSRLLNFFNSVIVVKALGPDKIGYSAILQSVTHQYGVFNELGLSELAVREKDSRAFAQFCSDIIFFRSLCFCTAAILGLGVLALAPALSPPPLILAVLGFAIFKNAIDPMFFYRAKGRMRLYYIIGLVAPICVSVFYLFFLEDFMFRGIDFIALHLSVGFANFVLFAIMLGAIGVQRPNIGRSIGHVVRNWKLAYSSIVNMTIASCQIFVAAWALGLSEMGLIRAAIILLVPCDILFTVVQNYCFPRVMDWVKASTVPEYCGRWLKTFAVPTLLGLAFVAVFPWEFVNFVLGEDFRFSSLYLGVVLTGKILLIYTVPCQITLWADKTNNAAAIASSIAFVVFVAAGIPFIAWLGVLGAAISVFAVDLTWLLVSLFVAFRWSGRG